MSQGCSAELQLGLIHGDSDKPVTGYRVEDFTILR